MAQESTLLANESSAGDGPPLPAAATAGRSRWRSIVIWLAKLALAIGCFVWLAQSGRLDFSRLAAARAPLPLAALAACTLGAMALPAWRWQLLLRVQGIDESIAWVTRVTWIGYFASLFLPGAAGGDLAKAVLVTRGRPVGKWRALSTVFVDRLVGLYAMLSITLVPCAWLVWRDGLGGAGPIVATAIAFWLAATIGLALFAYGPFQRLAVRVFPGERAAAIMTSWSSYFRVGPEMILAFLLSIASNLCWCAALYFAAISLESGIRPLEVCLVGPLVFLSNCVPLTPGGAGLGEAVSQQLFAAMQSLGGGEAMLLMRAVTVLFSLPAVVFFLGARRPSTRNISTAGDTGQ